MAGQQRRRRQPRQNNADANNRQHVFRRGRRFRAAACQQTLNLNLNKIPTYIDHCSSAGVVQN